MVGLLNFCNNIYVRLTAIILRAIMLLVKIYDFYRITLLVTLNFLLSKRKNISAIFFFTFFYNKK